VSGIDPNGGGALVVPGGGGTIAAADITDATATGIGLVTAANADAARTAIGAVPTSRTVAGAALSADVSAATLRTALAVDRALDANHVYAWRCDDAAGAGTVAAAAGGVAMSLTGSTWVQGDGGLYRSGRCLHLTAGAAGTDCAISGTLTAPAGSLTIEADVMLSTANGVVYGTSQTGILALYNGLGHYVFLRISWSAGASGFMGGWKPNASAEQSTSVGALPGANIPTAVPHHMMLSIAKGSGASNGTMSIYLDGEVVATTSGIYDASLLAAGGTWVATIANNSNTLAPLMRVGEVRISDIARDAAYARAAYATLRARS